MVPPAARHPPARDSCERASRCAAAWRRSLTQAFRLAAGGAIDRLRPLEFEFDGLRHEGYLGDTLASALLANGVHFVARRFKYHRPRGLFAPRTQEPNPLLPPP